MSAPFFEVEDPGWHEIMTLSARVRARFKWLLPYETRDEAQVSVSYPIGARFPVTRRSGRSRFGQFTVHAVTTGGQTSVLAGLLEEGHPVGLAHSQSACQVEDCTVPARRVVLALDWSQSREDAGDKQRTVWAIQFVPVDDSNIDVPRSTWWDVSNDYSSWYSVNQAYSSWKGVAERRAGDGTN